LQYRGVAKSARTNPTGDHLTGVQPNPQPQIDTVALTHIDGKPRRLLLKAQGRQTGPNGMVLQRHWRAEHRHDPIARPLCDPAAVAPHHRRTAVGEVGHDLAPPLRSQRQIGHHRWLHMELSTRQVEMQYRTTGVPSCGH